MHLLFHSSFFTDIGDFKSALKTFYELNLLFENNPSKWNNPPLDYLSALDGIPDSLRTIRSFEEMPFYIGKITQLSRERYPEYFRTVTDFYVTIYKLALLSGLGKYREAIEFIEDIPGLLSKKQTLSDYEKQSELHFYLALCYFGINDFSTSQKYINQVVLIGKINYQSVIYKASRLLNLIIHYEAEDFEYLDYEIRSYKRLFQNKGKLLQTEKAIFKFVQATALSSHRKNETKIAGLQPMFSSIEKDKFELQLVKYFDFIGWIKNKSSGKRRKW